MSIRQARFCDHENCAEIAPLTESNFSACDLCGGDFCGVHRNTTDLVTTPMPFPKQNLQIVLCEACSHFATTEIFGGRDKKKTLSEQMAARLKQRKLQNEIGAKSSISETANTLADLIKEHIRMKWAQHALQKGRET